MKDGEGWLGRCERELLSSGRREFSRRKIPARERASERALEASDGQVSSEG